MKPNVLVIMCDQLRYDCLIDSHVKTPNLDRLRKRGVCFHNAYSQTPVCIPARHSFISGEDAFSLGLEENYFPREKEIAYPLAREVRNQGYYTCAIGKMHFLPVREHFGFDHMFLSEEVPDHIMDDEYLQYLKEVGYGELTEPHGERNEKYYVPQVSVLPEEYHTTAWTARKTIEVIHKNKNRPFFVFSSFIKPHAPFEPSEPYNSMYNLEEIPDVIPKGEESAFDLMLLAQNGYKVNGFDNVTKEDIKKIRAHYYGCVTQVDKAIGDILDYLEENKLYEDTMIIFTSDHGEMLGDHGGFGKRTYYEESCKIPLVISYPSVFTKNTDTKALATHTDIYATIISAVGGTLPETCVGYDLNSVCTGEKEQVRDCIIAEYGREQTMKAMVRWEDKKYIYMANGRKELFFDINNDPKEQHPIHDEEIFKMNRKRVTEYFNKYQYTRGLSEGELVGYEVVQPYVSGYLNQTPKWPDTVIE